MVVMACSFVYAVFQPCPLLVSQNLNDLSDIHIVEVFSRINDVADVFVDKVFFFQGSLIDLSTDENDLGFLEIDRSVGKDRMHSCFLVFVTVPSGFASENAR